MGRHYPTLEYTRACHSPLWLEILLSKRNRRGCVRAPALHAKGYKFKPQWLLQLKGLDSRWCERSLPEILPIRAGNNDLEMPMILQYKVVSSVQAQFYKPSVALLTDKDDKATASTRFFTRILNTGSRQRGQYTPPNISGLVPTLQQNVNYTHCSSISFLVSLCHIFPFENHSLLK